MHTRTTNSRRGARLFTAAAALLALSASPARGQCDGEDDVFEENDTCEGAPTANDGGEGLTVSKTDPDWFRFQVPAQGTLILQLHFAHSEANVDLNLWSACGGALVAFAHSRTDGEFLFVVNGTNSSTDYYGEVYVDADSAGDCAFYDLEVEGAGLEVGEPFCTANPNSTGEPAHIWAEGSESASINELLLYAEPVPAHGFGLFYYGPEGVEIPFGNGFRCVASGGIGTFPLGAVSTGSEGHMSDRVDLASPPSAEGQITGGSTWYFQAWYRDPLARGSWFNLSDGVTITFVP